MIKESIKLAAIFLLLIIFINSCQTNNKCDTLTESLVKLSFYIKTESLDSAVSVKPISVYGLGNQDSLLYSNDSLSSVFLPLFPNGETLTYVFEFGSYTENIKFSYKTTTYFESVDCGFIANYEIESLSYKKDIIDTIIINNKNVSIESEEHIKLFFVNNDSNK